MNRVSEAQARQSSASEPKVRPFGLDRSMPASKEVEMAVLGAYLINPGEAGSQIREVLTEEHFYFAGNKVIFREISALQDALQAIDLITVTQRLLDKNVLEDVGGAAYLSELLTSCPSPDHAASYADVVYEKYLLRQLIEAGTEIVSR
jgi:replicative DNA helicase